MKSKQSKVRLCVVNPDSTSKEEKNFQKKAHFGVLLGYKNQSEFIVSHFIETPPEHENKRNDLPSASWMVEHAIQLKRMLIGGQLILGFYGIDSAKIKVDGLCEVAIKKLKKNENDLGNFIDSVYFWLYNDFSKWRCSQFCMKDEVDIRFIEPEKMQYLSSSWKIDLKFAVSSSTSLMNQIETIINNEERKIYEAVALVNGELAISKQNSPLLIIPREANNNNIIADHQVTLLMTGIKNMGFYTDSLGVPLQGVFSFSGNIISNVCMTKCTKFEAVEAIKRDISNSLRNRFYIWKEGIQNSNFNNTFQSDQELKICLPNRIIFSYQNIRLCDYKESSETLQDCKLRCQEILGTKEGWQSVLYSETDFGVLSLSILVSFLPNSLVDDLQENDSINSKLNHQAKKPNNGKKTESNKNSSSVSGNECEGSPKVLTKVVNLKLYTIVFVALVALIFFGLS